MSPAPAHSLLLLKQENSLISKASKFSSLPRNRTSGNVKLALLIFTLKVCLHMQDPGAQRRLWGPSLGLWDHQSFHEIHSDSSHQGRRSTGSDIFLLHFQIRDSLGLTTASSQIWIKVFSFTSHSCFKANGNLSPTMVYYMCLPFNLYPIWIYQKPHGKQSTKSHRKHWMKQKDVV